MKPQEKIKKDSHRDHRGHGGQILGALGVLGGKKLYCIYNEITRDLHRKEEMGETKCVLGYF